mgnify:CR=1 FL=1
MTSIGAALVLIDAVLADRACRTSRPTVEALAKVERRRTARRRPVTAPRRGSRRSPPHFGQHHVAVVEQRTEAAAAHALCSTVRSSASHQRRVRAARSVERRDHRALRSARPRSHDVNRSLPSVAPYRCSPCFARADPLPVSSGSTRRCCSAPAWLLAAAIERDHDQRRRELRDPARFHRERRNGGGGGRTSIGFCCRRGR